ncbi:MAG: hypothetical protein ACT4RN_00390 [Pseudonocardia sp.]
MHELLIRYRVRRDHLERNLQLLRAAYEELAAVQPAGLRWVTYQLDDELTFLDIVSGTAPPGQLASLPAFQRFRSTLDERCAEPPVMSELHTAGSYRQT